MRNRIRPYRHLGELRGHARACGIVDPQRDVGVVSRALGRAPADDVRDLPGGRTADGRGGATSAANGLGLCEACNYTKEAPGWQVVTTIDEKGTHRAEFTTPTGAQHESNAPPLLPGIDIVQVADIETALGIRLVYDAA